jgi:hypothetical protein
MSGFQFLPEQFLKIARSLTGVEVGAKVIIYTTVIRGATQASFNGTIIAINEQGIIIEGPSGKTFFPYSAMERVSL